MRFRSIWHFAVVAALTLGTTACDLNPQPEVPSDTEPGDDLGTAGASGENATSPTDPAPELGASSAKTDDDERDEPGRQSGFGTDDSNDYGSGPPTAGGGAGDDPGREEPDAGTEGPPDAAGTVAM
jgi:hypothetical protein